MSSKSSKYNSRFLESFHMTNATIPMIAKPPATDKPMMVDVPMPRLELLVEPESGTNDTDEDGVPTGTVTVYVTVFTMPLTV